MQISFLGAAREVGRSAILANGSKRFLLDYGVKLDGKTEYPQRLRTKIDAYVLSHAHLDHSGFAPALYTNGYVPAYGTPPTIELSRLLIEDSIKINARKKVRQEFSKGDLKRFQRAYVPLEYGSEVDIGNYTLSLFDAGHITGSAITLIINRETGKRLAYTGDYKLEPQMLQKGADVVKSDVLITESTYADREHPDRNALIKSFVDEIREIVENGGIALLPVFAVGRAQEMLAILYKNNLIDYAMIDGMAQKASDIVMRYPDYSTNKDTLFAAMKNTTWVGSERNRKSITGPSIIVTTSGMLTGGPVLDYVRMLNQKSKIFLTGYQIPGTNGRNLMEGKPLVIDGKKYAIKTLVSYYDFSAHAGRKDLYEYIRKSGPEKIICVHGDANVASNFAESLKLEGFDAVAPALGETISVDL
ncbi:MAG: MBL fold metallo-hydrolase [Candidatus Micrarchaeaceae archaeon]